MTEYPITEAEKDIMEDYITDFCLWCCGKDCQSDHGGKFFGEPLFHKYESEINVNLLYCQVCWVDNYRENKIILSCEEAREKYPNIEKDCFVSNCPGKVQARCLWCKKYTDNLIVYKTELDNEFYVMVAGHDDNQKCN